VRAADPIVLPFGDAVYDGVCSIGVLEHVWETGGDELASLKEIYRILKPGGKVFVFHFPNRTSWIELANRLCVKLGLFQKYTHGRLYTKQRIEQLVKDSGFALLEHGVYNLLPRNIFRNWPKSLANNALLIRSFHLLEQTLSLFLKIFSQNHFFILQK
jgi:ubiquinone/menaquinone biosynthesis C-methylase UbiE